MRLFIETLASYIPAIILKELQNQVENGLKTVPYRTSMDTVCMFCDVSGFTKLAEAMARSGEGAEGLAKNLNQVILFHLNTSVYLTRCWISTSRSCAKR